MPGDTNIEWADRTWNPATGCDEVSPGCARCYAKTFAERWRGIPGHPYEQGFDLRLWPERLDIPLRWKRPSRIFVNSMSDLFHEGIPSDFVAEVFAVMGAARQHVFQVLTKRPERMRAYLTGPNFVLDVERAARRRGINPWPGHAWGLDDQGSLLDIDDLPVFPNVWLGTSIENRRFVGRADDLRRTPAAIRFISAEPLLGPLVYDDRTVDGSVAPGHPIWYRHWRDDFDGNELDLTGIDWLIVGGESGSGARRMDLQWARDLRDAAREVGTAYFMKQLGGARPGTKLEDLPEDLRIREFPR